MLDTSAFELAGYEPVNAGTASSVDGAEAEATVLAGVAGCLACRETIGTCAYHLAGEGMLNPSTALSVCGAMQRMAQRALTIRSMSVSRYLAYVWLGPARPGSDHEAEAEALAERMR
jgi:hypothetical protein